MGKKKKETIYKIPCECTEYVYIVDMANDRNKRREHKAKVKLTKKDIEEGRLESTEVRMKTQHHM